MDKRFVCPVLALALILRISISFGGHSGQTKPPMYGDYEAQRHWQEVTYNLPIDMWYVNSTLNDLLYWGLDYPPLTAFHSKLLGHVAHAINPKWVELNSSRGVESYYHKVFMRGTVLVSEVFYLIPLTLFTHYITVDAAPSSRIRMLLMVVLTPGQPLIDHGHFQYNTISLGLTLLAVYAILHNRIYIGSSMFVLALNYKQMSLYHALPFFSYLLATRYNTVRGIKQVIKLGLVVILTFVVCWLPFLNTVPDVLIRMFPFNRGLFEDKVANFWCSLSLLIKVEHLMETVTLVRLALFATLVAVLPSQFHLFRNPTPDRFFLALTNSALGFFLFSFHVHEKTILIPSVTVMLLYNACPLATLWFQIIATFSMWPLILKDGQHLMYISSLGLYCSAAYLTTTTRQSPHVRRTFILSIGGCLALHILEMVVPPPLRYPYLYPALNAAYSAGHFILFFFYFHYLQIKGVPTLFPKSVKTE